MIPRLAAVLVLTAATASATARADEPAPPTPTPAPAPAPEKKPSRPVVFSLDGWQERGLTYDFNLEGGVGFLYRDPREYNFLGRVRAGVMVMVEPWYYTLGATYEYSSWSPASFGLQVEAMHLWSGGWLQLGLLTDIQPRPGLTGAVGWSLVGLETQIRLDYVGYPVWTAMLKLRLPVSWIVKAARLKAK